MDDRIFLKELTPGHLNQLVEKGQRLAIYLEPDTRVTQRKGKGEYLEDYQLPNLILQDGHLIASTDGNHLSSVQEARYGLRSYYSYTNICSAFIHHLAGYPQEDQFISITQFMSLARYQLHGWILRDDQELLWDGTGFIDKDLVIDRIRNGHAFRLALESEEGIWRINPVDLPFYLIEEDLFRFQTQIHWQPALFGQPNLMATHFRTNNYPMPDSPHAGEFTNQQELPSINSYLSVYSDGRYQSLEDLEPETHRRWKSLRLFCDRK